MHACLRAASAPAPSAREVAAAVEGAAGRAAASARADMPAAARARHHRHRAASLIEWSPTPVQKHPGRRSQSRLVRGARECRAAATRTARRSRRATCSSTASSTTTTPRVSPLAWLALFDLLQRADDRAAFDQLALQYVVAFERSAPAWEEGADARGPARKPGGGRLRRASPASSRPAMRRRSPTCSRRRTSSRRCASISVR